MEHANSRSGDVYEGSPASATEPLWTAKDVADYLRLKPETVRMMARKRKLPAMKVGKAWRFRVSDIKEMLKARAVEYAKQPV